MKEKDYTITIDVHVKKEDNPTAKRWYSFTIYGHPISENPGSFQVELSNMRDEQALNLGKKVLHAIWSLVETKDKKYWEQ